MSSWKHSLRTWLLPIVEQDVKELVVTKVSEDLAAGVYDERISQIIVETVRQRDDGLNRLGFIIKIAVELMDRSHPPLSFDKAKAMASEVYAQFRRDNEMVKFGAPGWDWSGSAARLLAYEYEIAHWEPC